ncbi:MAG: peptide-methionine (S)-S-oxide reductase MsrA [Caldilineaceae bacterium]|nr:peptide-methionine (S)-S-oxide reductase MsrA [Caldilineaceae bacterium]
MKLLGILCTAGVFCLLVACAAPPPPVATAVVTAVATPVPDPNNLETATLAGGCFWSMQRALDAVPGVITTTVGYAGGIEPNPTYAQVVAKMTGHAEAVEVIFDAAQISYADLLDAYWHEIDPVAVDRQFCDQGPNYRSAIFYHTTEQQQVAAASKAALAASGRFTQPIATAIVAVTPFYPAESYHQKYYLKRPDDYARYRVGCGRDARLAELWGTGR